MEDKMTKVLTILFLSSLFIGVGYAQEMEINDLENNNSVEVSENDAESNNKEVETNSVIEEEEEDYSTITTHKYHNYFGLCSGLTYKYGISYRRWFQDDNFALQLHIFPLIMKVYDDYDDEYYTYGKVKAGLTFLKKIKSYKYVRLLYYLNGTFSYDVDREYNWNSNTYEDEYINTEELSVGAATGPGFEFYIWRFSIDVFLGVSSEYNIDTEEYFVLPAAETALHFRF